MKLISRTGAELNEQVGLPVPHAIVRQDRVPVQRYFDPDFYEMECELLWSRVWQMACRLEEIPEPGDFVEYENVGRSIVLVRRSPIEVKAFYNACRHRGVKLVEDRGTLRSGFVCPFHGWCYGLDGANTFLYQPDLFAEDNRVPEDVGLRECRVELWGGCAFINFDDDAPPLRQCIEPFATTLDAVACRHPPNRVVARVPSSRQLEAGNGSFHGGIPRDADPSAAASVERSR